MTTPAYRGPWPQLRLLILARDNYLCQLRLPGCKTKATQVDHIIGIKQDPTLAWDVTNCQAACKSCNVAKGNRDNPRPTGHYYRRRNATASREW